MEEEIKKILSSLGAQVCGIASIERFQDAPQGFSPRDIFSKCQSVIAFGMALPKGIYEVDPRLIYSRFNGDIICNQVDETAFLASRRIEDTFLAKAVPIPCDAPNDYWEPETLTAKGMISMKHTAVLCGLGQLGKSSLLLNPVYGNRLTIGAILTDLPLKSDEMSESICIPGCHKCEDSCPVHAIANQKVSQKLCRPNTYGQTARGFGTVDCNRCRTVCPVCFGKGAAL